MSAEEIASVGRIEATRRIIRKAAGACGARGATVEEQAIAASYAAFDLAGHHVGAGQSAIEWLRTFCDVLERSMMAGADDRTTD